jgi:hypothetical protein
VNLASSVLLPRFRARAVVVTGTLIGAGWPHLHRSPWCRRHLFGPHPPRHPDLRLRTGAGERAAMRNSHAGRRAAGCGRRWGSRQRVPADWVLRWRRGVVNHCRLSRGGLHGGPRRSPRLAALAAVHAYSTAFWCVAGLYGFSALLLLMLFPGLSEPEACATQRDGEICWALQGVDGRPSASNFVCAGSVPSRGRARASAGAAALFPRRDLR